MDRFLVTGGAGFIGTHVVRRLLAEGHGVRVLDNFDPFYAISIKRRNVEECVASSADGAFELLEGDFRDPETCRRAVDGVKGILHIGALAGVRPSIQEPARYMDVNVTGTQTLLAAVGERPGDRSSSRAALRCTGAIGRCRSRNRIRSTTRCRRMQRARRRVR